MTKNILLLGFIGLAFATFSQNSIPIINKEDYNYYEDSLQGYPHPFRFYPAERRPEATNMDEIGQKIFPLYFPKEADIDYCASLFFKVLVDENGCYIKHMIVKRAHPLLVNTFEPYIPSLRFTPAIQDGKPIKFWVVVPFRLRCH